jgi:hypothetical protein
MPATLSSSRTALKRLIKDDRDPRVRRRAHALLLVAEGQPLSRIARLFHTAPHRLRVWRAQFLARGRAGLVDAPAQDGLPNSAPPPWSFWRRPSAGAPTITGYSARSGRSEICANSSPSGVG